MNQLSIAGKATRYDEALKEAVIAHKDEDRHLKATLERIFPELAKSEDEKIKEDLIQWISDFPDMIWSGHYREDVIKWLEKQDKKTSWKPSEEQMDALETAVSSLQSNTLERLYQDLKRETNYE